MFSNRNVNDDMQKIMKRTQRIIVAAWVTAALLSLGVAVVLVWIFIEVIKQIAH